jgi:peptidyl-prolyl cis-trans isomerase B (cyclophilin B)
MLRIGAASFIISGLIVGCGHKQPATANGGPGSATTNDAGSPVAVDPRLQQSFADATTDPPPDEHRPPDTTMTNKSVGQLYTEVTRLWDDIRFVSPSGKRLAYFANVDTEMGPIEIVLLPDLAPNHVRSFVALARAGYFDGLVFDRTVHQEVNGRPDARVEYIEAGCPLGTGEAGYGSIGYWLKSECDPQAPHEEGMVGASHGEEADVSACKFYINLSKSADIDGNYTVFGKVTSGLNVARNILALPVRRDTEFPDADHPVKPVVIRKVTIRTEEIDAPLTQ